MPAFIVIQLIDKLRHLWAGGTWTRGWSLGDIWKSPSSAQRAEGPFGAETLLSTRQCLLGDGSKQHDLLKKKKRLIIFPVVDYVTQDIFSMCV